jgi:hypothetical protein
MSEQAVIAHCDAEKIGISFIGPLPAGGTRLVCMSVAGAAHVRRGLKTSLLDEGLDSQHGPGWNFIPRS